MLLATFYNYYSLDFYYKVAKFLKNLYKLITGNIAGFISNSNLFIFLSKKNSFKYKKNIQYKS